MSTCTGVYTYLYYVHMPNYTVCTVLCCLQLPLLEHLLNPITANHFQLTPATSVLSAMQSTMHVSQCSWRINSKVWILFACACDVSGLPRICLLCRAPSLGFMSRFNYCVKCTAGTVVSECTLHIMQYCYNTMFIVRTW